ncbi:MULTISPECIES: formylmethanofuran--tetrahydromethanopterin N-formyltransferase [Rhodomicrobium]|uniref:formylmethanofuran--tetrahydromethanopterin N-formyltransferase n=1 Tax=Rhodomicrobium TaxID=1068 RepID=UPI000B4BEB31|nr:MULTISPECIES: formylmethanofuran--tetrahydromethanopterin N-formyltransferase [Rhodomicrobium]
MPDVKPRGGLWERLVGRPDPEAGGGDGSALVNGLRVAHESIEAVRLAATALIVTGPTPDWARTAALAVTGPTGDGCDAGIDRPLSPSQTPDGRPGVRVLFFAATAEALELHLAQRIWQSLFACPGAACYAGLRAGPKILLGAGLRQFGDGFELRTEIGGRRLLRLPVMDGEFVCEAKAGLAVAAIGAAALLVMGRTIAETLAACDAAAAAMREMPDVILPAPGGVTRAALKAGSRSADLAISIDEAYCPTLTALAPSALAPDAGSALRLAVNGLTVAAVAAALRAGVAVLTETGAPGGLIRLGAAPSSAGAEPHRFPLLELLA